MSDLARRPLRPQGVNGSATDSPEVPPRSFGSCAPFALLPWLRSAMGLLRVTLAASTSVSVLVLAAGCGLDPGGAWNRTENAGPIGSGTPSSSGSNADATDQRQGLCPMTSSVFTNTKRAGDICTVAGECASTCCNCGAGQASWLAASCVSGRCVDSLTSCGRTRSRYCGGGTVIAPPPTAQCGARAGTSTCDACIVASCCPAQLACDANDSCSALANCDALCAANADCRQRCYDTHSTGAAALASLDRCVAKSCASSCGS